MTFLPRLSRSTVGVAPPSICVALGRANGARLLRRSAGCAIPCTPWIPMVTRLFPGGTGAIDLRPGLGLTSAAVTVTSAGGAAPLPFAFLPPHASCAPPSSARVNPNPLSAVGVGAPWLNATVAVGVGAPPPPN